MLLLANENHTALEPGLAMWILYNTFERYSFSSIDSVIYFTANLEAEHPDISQNLFVWIPSHRNPDNRCDEQLLRRLQKSWIKCVNFIIKEPVHEIHSKDITLLNGITNK